jgi:hypothetical protein
LNDKPAKDYDVPAIGDLLTAGEGRNVTISFRHGKSLRTISFKLQPMI